MDFDWKAVVQSVAPTLATALGGPLAGVAVGALSEAVLGKKNGTEKEISQALQTASPDLLLAMKKADQDFQVRMTELGVDLEKLANQDRDSARQREIAVKDKTPSRLAYMIIGGFFAISIAQIIGLMGYGDIVSKVPPQGWLLIGNISGYLANEAKAAASYFFGTTEGSKEKTDLLARAEPIK